MATIIPTLRSTPAPRTQTRSRTAERVRGLALAGPLLLFAHGILDWVDGLGDAAGTGAYHLAATAALVGALAALGWLALAVAVAPSDAARMPLTSIGIAALAGVALASPWDLLPLGALLLLIALAPLIRGDGAGDGGQGTATGKVTTGLS
ncbi:MAG: hypothetical protein ABIS35_01530 [Terracoccus sp.]